MVHILTEWEKWSSTVVIQKYGPNLSWEPGFWSVLVLYLENNPPGPRFRLGFPAKWRFELSTSPVETGTVFGIHCLWGVSAPKHQRVTNQKNRGRLEFGGVKPTKKKNFEQWIRHCLNLFFLVLCLGEQFKKVKWISDRVTISLMDIKYENTTWHFHPIRKTTKSHEGWLSHRNSFWTPNRR